MQTDQRGDVVPGYIFDHEFLSKGGTNSITDNLWNYVKKNTIDLVIIRGKSAAKLSREINDRHQQSVGFGTEIKYVTNPDIGTQSSTGMIFFIYFY